MISRPYRDIGAGEPGLIGGEPAPGLDFGAAAATDAVRPQNAPFDSYGGGGLDLAVLGMAEADGARRIEIPPGADLERDILSQRDVAPILDGPTLMDAPIFRPEAMDLRKDMLHLDLDERIALDPARRILILNWRRRMCGGLRRSR